MKKLLLICALAFTGLLAACSVESDDTQTIYLIRHAEKVKDGSNDPALTELGKARAVTYAEYFADKGIEVIYSSDLIRTRDTVAPLIKATGLELQLYNPGDLNEIAERLLADGRISLVSGHSNTTAVLSNLITGDNEPDLEDHHYDRIYILTENKDGSWMLRIDNIPPYTP